MNNYQQSGNILTLTAPGGGVVNGTGYRIGNLFVVAMATVAVGESFSGLAVGVVELPKNNTQAVSEGDLIYWNAGAGEATTTPNSNMLIGAVTEDALAADTVCKIRLNGVARANEPA